VSRLLGAVVIAGAGFAVGAPIYAALLAVTGTVDLASVVGGFFGAFAALALGVHLESRRTTVHTPTDAGPAPGKPAQHLDV